MYAFARRYVSLGRVFCATPLSLLELAVVRPTSWIARRVLCAYLRTRLVVYNHFRCGSMVRVCAWQCVEVVTRLLGCFQCLRMRSHVNVLLAISLYASLILSQMFLHNLETSRMPMPALSVLSCDVVDVLGLPTYLYSPR